MKLGEVRSCCDCYSDYEHYGNSINVCYNCLPLSADVSKTRNFVNALKKYGRCKDCGIRDERVLEFDHLPEYKKEFNIAEAYRCMYSIGRIIKEIEKCDLVCSNCHKIRTKERFELSKKK